MSSPFVKAVVPKRAADGSGTVVILERIEVGVTSCVHGQVPCHWCDEWCWLGSETYALVAAGDAAPMCRQCGAIWIPKGMKKVGHVDDH